MQRAPAPDPRRGRGRRDEPLPRSEPLDQVDAFGPHGEHRLGADIDPVAADGLEPQLPPEAVTGLEDRHVRVGERVADLQCGDEPGDATPDDDDVWPRRDGGLWHALSVSRTTAAAGTGPSAPGPG